MRPTLRAVLLLAGLVPVAALPSILGPAFAAAWAAALAAALAAIGSDAALGTPRGRVGALAQAPALVFVGDRGALAVRVEVRGSRVPRAVSVLADLHPDLEPQPERALPVGEDGIAVGEVPLVPRRRGRPGATALWLRWTGPLGLVERRKRVPLEVRFGVTPDVRPVRAAALRFLSTREFASGAHLERATGGGTEFDSLREYAQGLDPRSIDWKATARHRRPLCRQFRAERDRRVVLALDTGRLMREPLGALPRLDHAIHAALLLAYVALRTGDRVGMLAFDERPRAFVEPEGGIGAFARLRAAATGLEYSTVETNFSLALTELHARLERRSLVVVLTDFADAVTAELMVESLERLRRRHLVVFAALRDPALDAVADAEPRTSIDLHRAVVAADLLRDREAVLKRLRRRGVLTVDARPDEVSTSLLNRYLDVRRRELVG
jgi:uncharacterized protein (DUF58 family)